MPSQIDFQPQTDTLPAVPPRVANASAARRFGAFLRRCHMYIALFLTPWMAMYALSTVAFNHWQWLDRFYGGRMDSFQKEKEVVYDRTFAPESNPRDVAEQIMKDLRMPGGMRVNADEEDRIVINRADPITPRRITYFPGEKKILIEKQAFRTAGFLTRLHSRVGYGEKQKAAKIWAVSVDVSIVATLLWVFSGLWMWWELKVTRRWGWFFAVLGIVVFGTFLMLG